jgi:hypothetical protein
MRETIARDLRDAVRTVRRSPLFSAIAMLLIAPGAGANTATFSCSMWI